MNVLCFQEVKQRKPVERRESTRLASAAKLLRSFSKTKDVVKSTETPTKGSKVEDQNYPPELPDRNHPAYLSEGKGSRKRKNSGKESKESKGKDRSHSFHGKLDKKEKKYVALERKASKEKKYKDDTPETPSHCQREETVFQGARSILLTEDNLIPISSVQRPVTSPVSSPDLIQDLPRSGDLGAGLISAAKSEGDNADDDDYVEADSVALEGGEQEDNDICPSGHGDIVHQRTISATNPDSVMELGSRDASVRNEEIR